MPKVCWANHSGVTLEWVVLTAEGKKKGKLSSGLHFEDVPEGENVGAGWDLISYGETAIAAVKPPPGLAALHIAKKKSKSAKEDYEEMQRIIQEVRNSLED